MKIVSLVLLGIIATMKGVFDEGGISDLGRLIYFISLPCLIFTNIITEVDIDKLSELWRLPVFAVLHITSGYFIGKSFNFLLRFVTQHIL